MTNESGKVNEHHLYSNEELLDIRARIKKYLDTEVPVHFDDDDELEQGIKCTAIIINHAKQNDVSEKMMEGYYKCPPFMLYTRKTDPTAMVRVYGLMEIDGEIRAASVRAMMMCNNNTVGGTPLDDLIPVKKWNNEQLERLSSGMYRDTQLFLEQMGFAYMLS